MPLDNIHKCAVLLMLLDHLREEEWNDALYSPVIQRFGLVYKKRCTNERSKALADIEKRLHKCADNAKLVVVMTAQNELP